MPSDAELMGVVLVITRIIEAAGIAVILVGLVASFVVYGRRWLVQGEREKGFHALRSNIGRSILLGLELLVAADIISTVAIEPTVESVLVLAGIVLIRTFLSFSLEVEIEGKLPWRRAATTHQQASRADPDTPS